MPLIGLTGGVATGKSTVAEMLRKRGAVVISADEAARRVVEPGAPTLQEVSERFGSQYLREDGSLDRARLAERVFNDPSARKELESITHPAIRRLVSEQIAYARANTPPETVIVVEVPLLYEVGMEGEFDAVVVVGSSEESSIRRMRIA